MRLHRKYKTRGVTFLSLSGDPQEKVQELIDKYDIGWTSGYGASNAIIESLGAPNAGVMVPLLYVIGRDQKITWSDRQARYNHENPKQIVKSLEQAIQSALRKAGVVHRASEFPARLIDDPFKPNRALSISALSSTTTPETSVD